MAQAFAQARSAALRLTDSEAELKDAVESADKNFQALTQTKNAGGVLLPLVRPQEVVASLQALSQAYVDYYGATADYDRAQFRLYHARPPRPSSRGAPVRAEPRLRNQTLALIDRDRTAESTR